MIFAVQLILLQDNNPFQLLDLLWNRTADSLPLQQNIRLLILGVILPILQQMRERNTQAPVKIKGIRHGNSPFYLPPNGRIARLIAVYL
ncbi:hypothetical protein D3C73_1239250 [compost metagenome]